MKFSCPFVRFPHLALLSLIAVTLSACGGGSASPSGPSLAGAVVLTGSVVGATSASSASSAYGSTASPTRTLAGSSMVVSVAEAPALSTTVGVDGSFTLRGLPTGVFTLVFTRDGTKIGTISFSSVLPNQELNVTVSLSGGGVVLLEEQRNGIGHGDLEIEGRVEQVLLLSATGDSRFIIHGHTVVARPGQTTIRAGNIQKLAADLTVGLAVHVKGTWLPAEGTVQPVLASEIKIQHGSEDEAPSPTPTPAATPTPRPACLIEGGRPGQGIELEGTISTGDASAFRLNVDGERASGLVDVLAGGAKLECTPNSGPNAPTPAQCSASVKAGARVHVGGTLDSCSATSAQVSASRIQVQK